MKVGDWVEDIHYIQGDILEVVDISIELDFIKFKGIISRLPIVTYRYRDANKYRVITDPKEINNINKRIIFK